MLDRDDDETVVSQKWSWKILTITGIGFLSDVFTSLASGTEAIQQFLIADCNYDHDWRNASLEIESLPTTEE